MNFILTEFMDYSMIFFRSSCLLLDHFREGIHHRFLLQRLNGLANLGRPHFTCALVEAIGQTKLSSSRGALRILQIDFLDVVAELPNSAATCSRDVNPAWTAIMKAMTS